MVAKFTRGSKLSPGKRQELVLTFCQAIQSLKSDEEVAKFLTDLLSPQETEMLAKRLQIAEYLLKGERYATIRAKINVGFGTIARVATWLGLSGEGFKLVLSRKRPPPKETSARDYDPFSFYNIKRRYTLHYWPSLLLERIFRESDQRHQRKITSILQSMEVKKKVFTAEFNKQIFGKFASAKPGGK